MEVDRRTVQTDDVGMLAGILLRVSNTAEMFAGQLEQAVKESAAKDKTIAELTAKCKRLIDEKNGHVVTADGESAPGNGVTAG